ncbi:MAG TPA: hypothetical protein VNI54_09250 [Thermoanaerobaculia bacterium]|nr:hypothetical protein [Thermoanaerobaculia bacterium]
MHDRDFVTAFESCTLPPDLFPHRAHVRLAWLYLREHGLLESLRRYSDGIQRYAASLGASSKYHHTITWAFLFLIHERMAAVDHTTFDEFASANEDLFGPVLERYYSPAMLKSDLARRTFVMPDLFQQTW